MHNLPALYHQDYTAWARNMAELLRQGAFSQLDIPHLVEELEDMGKSDLRELESRLRILLAHLLKWQYQYQNLTERWREFEGKSWNNTIITQRAEIKILLRKHPSLKSSLTEVIAQAYPDARELAACETGIAMNTFPITCAYSEIQILAMDFYPASE